MDGSEAVRAQFARTAENYVGSHFHADETRLQEVRDLVEPRPEDVVLDVATGTGHAALALAPHVAWVIGLDLTPRMLDLAAAAARSQDRRNLTWVLGDAGALPFPAESFDVYVARAAPHHFPDLGAALSEAFRVLRPGARACVIDCSPPLPARDFMHGIELERDATHVRSSTVEEWQDAFTAAGFTLEVARRRELPWRFANWMRTANLEGAEAERLAREIEAAPPEVREQLQPERRDGELWHRYWHALVRARKPHSVRPTT